MSAKTKSSVVSRLAFYLVGLAVPTFITFYLMIWLQDIDLKYYRYEIVRASKGLMPLTEDNSLQLEVGQVLYKKKPVNSLSLVRFGITNETWQNYPSGARFFFVTTDGAPFPAASIMDMNFVTKSQSDLVIAKRDDDPYIGPGFRFESNLQPGAEVLITLVIDTTDESPKVDTNSIVLRKAYGNGRLIQKKDTVISMTISKFLIWCFGSAAGYALFWMLVNVYLGNYTLLARIINWSVIKLGGKGFIP